MRSTVSTISRYPWKSAYPGRCNDFSAPDIEPAKTIPHSKLAPDVLDKLVVRDLLCRMRCHIA